MPYMFIKLGVDGGLTPGFLAWSRVTLAALVLLPFALRSGALKGLPLRWVAVFAAVEIAIPFPLIGFGEQRVSSSLAAILIAAVPLVIAALALRFDHAERPTRTRLIGMIIGLGGVVALVGIDLGGSTAALVGAGAHPRGDGGLRDRAAGREAQFSEFQPLGPVTAAMAAASVMLLPFGIADFPAETPPADAIARCWCLGWCARPLRSSCSSACWPRSGPAARA